MPTINKPFIMIKVLCFIGVTVLGFVASRLLSWAFWLILHILNGAVLGVTIVFWVFALPAIAGILYGVISWIVVLFAKMCPYKWYKVIPTAFIVWHGATCVVMPWGYKVLGGINAFTAIYMSIEALFIFGSFAWVLWNKTFDEASVALKDEDKPASDGEPAKEANLVKQVEPEAIEIKPISIPNPITEIKPVKQEEPKATHYLRDAVIRDIEQDYGKSCREVLRYFTKDEVKQIDMDAKAYLKELDAIKDSPVLRPEHREEIKKKWEVLDGYIRNKSMLSWAAEWLEKK